MTPIGRFATPALATTALAVALAPGMVDQRVETRAFGESYPVADNGSASGRQQNRRVEIVFSDANGKFATQR